MDDWERVNPKRNDTYTTYRAGVEGGALYRYGDKLMVFVPTPRTSAQEPQSPFPMGQVLPKVHRSVGVIREPYMPAQDQIIDAEFDEIPAGDVNGTEVIDAVPKSG